MAYRCDICGKTDQHGHNVSFSQRKTNRRFLPNLHTKKVMIGNSRLKLKICAQCLRRIKKQERATAKPAEPTKV